MCKPRIVPELGWLLVKEGKRKWEKLGLWRISSYSSIHPFSFSLELLLLLVGYDFPRLHIIDLQIKLLFQLNYCSKLISSPASCLFNALEEISIRERIKRR